MQWIPREAWEWSSSAPAATLRTMLRQRSLSLHSPRRWMHTWSRVHTLLLPRQHAKLHQNSKDQATMLTERNVDVMQQRTGIQWTSQKGCLGSCWRSLVFAAGDQRFVVSRSVTCVFCFAIYCGDWRIECTHFRCISVFLFAVSLSAYQASLTKAQPRSAIFTKTWYF